VEDQSDARADPTDKPATAARVVTIYRFSQMFRRCWTSGYLIRYNAFHVG